MTPFQMMILSGLISAAALPASAEVPRVVTDLPITASLVQQVMGDLGQPDLLLDKGADPHHFQLRPDQARALSRADLLIWVGPEMTPWLDRGAESLASDTSALLLLAVPQTHRIAFAEAEAEAEAEAGDHHDDHADSHDHAGGHDHGHGHDHDHSGLDPHAWLDPENALTWLDAIAGALAEADPENAETYAANAADAHRQIAALDAELRAELAPYTDQRFVVFHDAYGYFTQHYGLHPAIPVSLGDASAPSAGQLGAKFATALPPKRPPAPFPRPITIPACSPPRSRAARPGWAHPWTPAAAPMSRDPSFTPRPCAASARPCPSA